MMEGFLIVAGFVAWLLVAVACGCGLVWSCLIVLERLIANREKLVRADERREIGTHLAAAAWWFSEDKITMDLLAAAAQDMLKGHDPLHDVSVVRDVWRHARYMSTEGESHG